MNDHPLVSVVIPTFNRWPHVADAVRSVKNQTYSHVECLVVDDASTDGTVAKLASQFPDDDTLRIIRLEDNVGQGAARNHGARLAAGELLCFLDSDDLQTETSIASRVDVYLHDRDYTGLSFGDNITAGHDKPLMPGSKATHASLSLAEYARDRGWLHTNTFMIPRNAFLELEGFREDLRQKQDVEFFLRALCRYPARYCGDVCSRMRDLKDIRARNDYARIIRQGTQFIDAIRNNGELVAQLPADALDDIIRRGILTYLNALYKGNQPHQFRRMVRCFYRQGYLSLTGKLLKRYLLSFLQRFEAS